MKLNYESEHYKNDTIGLSPCASNCANEKLPEVTLTEIARSNSVALNTLQHAVNNLYTHLYGDTTPCTTEGNTGPTCLWDELTNQSRTLLLTTEKLTLICNKLGM